MGRRIAADCRRAFKGFHLFQLRPAIYRSEGLNSAKSNAHALKYHYARTLVGKFTHTCTNRFGSKSATTLVQLADVVGGRAVGQSTTHAHTELLFQARADKNVISIRSNTVAIDSDEKPKTCTLRQPPRCEASTNSILNLRPQTQIHNKET